MPRLPAPGTFRLYPFAEPPVPAGQYVLTGDVSGLPGGVAQMRAAVHITAPRYTMPPDQILSTFPPAGSRGAFGTRLPQIVLRRRTLPWERSPDLDHDVTTTPTPWLALVLVAEGEGQLRTDVDVKDTVTPGVSLGDDTDAPKGACLEIPASVVTKVFPTRDDLPMLCHLREVDLADTELALGDDDGYMAVVLGNRLPQPGVKYLACLVNLEGQYGRLPVIPDEQLVISYVPAGAVYDIGSQLRATYGDQASYDTATMGLLPQAGFSVAGGGGRGAGRASRGRAGGQGGRRRGPVRRGRAADRVRARRRRPHRLRLGRGRRRGGPGAGRHHRHREDEAGRRVLLRRARQPGGRAGRPGAALPCPRLLVVHLR